MFVILRYESCASFRNCLRNTIIFRNCLVPRIHSHHQMSKGLCGVLLLVRQNRMRLWWTRSPRERESDESSMSERDPLQNDILSYQYDDEIMSFCNKTIQILCMWYLYVSLVPFCNDTKPCYCCTAVLPVFGMAMFWCAIFIFHFFYYLVFNFCPPNFDKCDGRYNSCIDVMHLNQTKKLFFYYFT